MMLDFGAVNLALGAVTTAAVLTANFLRSKRH